MYLLEKYSMSQRPSQIIFVYFQIIDAPTSNLCNIYLGLNPWTNLYNTTTTIFLISSCDFIKLKHEKNIL